MTLPPVPPGRRFTARVRLPRDSYVRVAGNDYSAQPAAVAGTRIFGLRGAGPARKWHEERHRNGTTSDEPGT